MSKLVSELEGAELDYFVAKALGFNQDESKFFDRFEYMGGKLVREDDGIFLVHGAFCRKWCPSTNWQQGGEIIDREKISIVHFYDICGAFLVGSPYTGDDYIDGGPEEADALGTTPLIAAMRAYCVFKFGEEVESI